ncbi:MAG: hypothetical protein H8D56_21445 [Planctomycetes bacterium]|nr:hypothetical protein [Planctomycetota bacterium]MBL7145267.1 hypothetical protein [Phycisphaerae bacterium]
MAVPSLLQILNILKYASSIFPMFYTEQVRPYYFIIDKEHILAIVTSLGNVMGEPDCYCSG